MGDHGNGLEYWGSGSQGQDSLHVPPEDPKPRPQSPEHQVLTSNPSRYKP